MERTSLYQEHIASNGKLVDFEGWELPVQYTSIIDEHITTRTKAGLFDVSHMGEITLKGKDAESFLRSLIPTSLDRIDTGRCMYSCLCNERGGVIDDIFVYMIAQDDYLLVVNAATVEKDLRWLKTHISGEVEIENISNIISKIDLQGPFSRQILTEVFFDKTVAELERFSFTHSTFESRPILISCSGYTGEHGYEFYVHNEIAPDLWKLLLDRGNNFGIVPAGLGARDTLRLESCYSLYGHELSESITPVEAGIGWIINSKDDFIGKSILIEQKKHGAPRETICLELIDKGVPREKCPMSIGDEEIGVTTSGGFSPTFRKGIAMALVKRGSVKEDGECAIVIREKAIRAKRVKRPFYTFNEI
jgi:aminomethyltransferase